MKLKLLAFAFILAFAITSFGALGVSGVSASPTLVTPGGEVVEGPVEACDGAERALAEILDNTTAPTEAGLSLDNTGC